MSDILSNNEWSSNAELMADVAAMGWLPGPVLDTTYGLGKFWTVHTPDGLVANDLDKRKGDHHHDMDDLPGEWVQGFASVVFDPPYKLNGTSRQTSAMDERYGVLEPRTVAERLALLTEGTRAAAECVAPGGWLHVKCQAQIASNQYVYQPGLVIESLAGEPFTLQNIWSMRTTPMPQPRQQRRPRNNASQLVSFRRKGKRTALSTATQNQGNE